MKKICLLNFLTLLMILPFSAIGQDHSTWNDLIISELYYTGDKYGQTAWGYVEFTNMGTDTLDLNKYWAQTSQGPLNNVGIEGSHQKTTLGRYEGHKLLPGDSYTWVVSQQNDAIDRYGYKMYPNDYVNSQAHDIADYVMYTRLNLPGHVWMREKVFALYCRADTNETPDGVADSAMVDKFWYESSELNDQPNSAFPIAGIVATNPYMAHVWVRKFEVKKGNTDFNSSRGSTLRDSEWQPLPRNLGPNDVIYTTIDYHNGSGDLSITPKVPSISVDMNAMQITLPYDVPKDSLFRKFSYGPNHGWEFVEGPDTASYFVADGDTAVFYLVGDSLETFEFALKPETKPADFAKVSPLIYKNTNGNFTKRYTVSDGHSPMDTIGQIPYSLPIDTFLTYLVIDENASTEFIWVDDMERPELKEGDILRITSGGTVKDYKLSVWPYLASSESRLASVIFPGLEMWENQSTFELTDTMLDFVSGGFSYVLELPEGTEQSPAVIVDALSPNANVYISRAKNLAGSEADRTITISVMAEDDSTKSTYKFLLSVARETPDVVGDLFFTDIAGYWRGNGAAAIQIFNPSNTTVNISDYFIAHVTTTDFNAWVEGGIWEGKDLHGLNSNAVRPGFYIEPDAEGTPLYTADYTMNNVELEPLEEWCAMGAASWPSGDGSAPKEVKDQVDLLWGRYGVDHSHLNQTKAYWQERWAVDYPYDPESDWLLMNSLSFPRYTSGPTYALFKIKNDSVKDGTKHAFKNFHEDYELVDVVNGLTTTKTNWTLYYKFNGVDTVFSSLQNNGCVYRHPRVYKGNTVDRASFGSEGHEGEWIPYGYEYDEAQDKYNTIKNNNDKGDLGTVEFGRSRFKNHTMVTSAHIPYLDSKVYIISKGLSQSETILGVESATSVDAFMDNISIADTGMVIVVKDNTGTEKTGSEVLVTGDVVTSTSATGLTTVTYMITVASLSSNTTLVAKDGAEFSISDTSIIDVPLGMTIIDFVSKLEAPETASMVVTDGNEYIIPTVLFPADTNATERVKVMVNDVYVVEVTAQNGVDVAKYSISFKAEDDVYALSDVYSIDQSLKQVNYVSSINVANFLANIIASPGAEAIIINKLGQKREYGMVQYRDRLSVRKGDVIVNYYIKFINEEKDEVAVENVERSIGKVYPNPSTGTFTVNRLENATDIRIINITGQLVKSVKVTGSSMPIRMHSKSGIYFVSVMNKNKVIETHKVIVE